MIRPASAAKVKQPFFRRFGLMRSSGARHGVVLAASMIAAGGLDYSVNVVAGRWLEPIDFGVFVSVTALLQVFLLLSIAIRMVVAVHTAEFALAGGQCVAPFLRRVWHWSWQWGLIATTLAVLASPLAVPVLQLPNAWPLWAGSLALLPLFLREATFGALQGIQSFTLLGIAQVVPALLRLIFGIGLILAGGRAAGAILAQPLAYALGALLTLWWLRPYYRGNAGISGPGVSWSSSLSTMGGLAVLALMTNLDALFVKIFYSPEAAGNYGPVVTLERISLFLPWAVGLLLLPKVVQRKMAGRDPRPLLVLALAAALAPGLAITGLYFLFPSAVVRLVFGSAYADPGVVLGLAGLAASLYGGLNIWLNYAVSLKRHSFMFSLACILILQAAGMYLLGRDDLVRMSLATALAGLLGNLAGLLCTWSPDFPAVTASVPGRIDTLVKPEFEG
jgi:O-antigen/teichoic acid export membrane protein